MPTISGLPSQSGGLNGDEVVAVDLPDGTTVQFPVAAIAALSPKRVQVAASDETTALTAGVAKVTFRMPFGMIPTGVRASLTTAQGVSSASTLTIDINENGVSILSTKLTIDDGEKTSLTALVPAVLSSTYLDDDAEITIDIDQVGSGAAGLKITLLGY